MKKRVNILFQCDNNFAFMAGVAFTSLVLNASVEVDYYVYVLTPDMSEGNREKYKEVAKQNPNATIYLEFLDANICHEEVKKWNVPSHRGSWVTYYKLLINRFHLEEKGVDKILHIGADTLVTGSLEELADFDFEGMPFAMNWNETKRCPYYPKDAHYCIAEMVYFNLKEWRLHDCEQRIITHIKKHGDIYGSKDQGILCTQFVNEYAQLPLKFNIYGMTFYFHKFNKYMFNNAEILSHNEIDQAYEKPEIIHIARTFLYRPCEEDSLDKLNDMWWEYCKLSPWRDMKPLPVMGTLNGMEKMFRFIFKHFPSYIAEWLYIMARRWSTNFDWLVWAIKNKGTVPKL